MTNCYFGATRYQSLHAKKYKNAINKHFGIFDKSAAYKRVAIVMQLDFNLRLSARGRGLDAAQTIPA